MTCLCADNETPRNGLLARRVPPTRLAYVLSSAKPRSGAVGDLTDDGLALPPFAVVEIVDALAEPAANIYGGLALSCGTTGFSVKSSVSGERGITAAGLCGNSQSFPG